MLTRIRNYIYDRRHALVSVAGFAAGVYLARDYLQQRWAELQESVLSDMEAKDALRKKFEQTQEDCAFAVEAVLPTFGEQVVRGMDVDAVTGKLAGMRRQSAVSAVSAVSSSGGSEGDADRGRERGGDVGVVLPTIPGGTPVDERPPLPLPTDTSPPRPPPLNPPTDSPPALTASISSHLTQDSAQSWVSEFASQSQQRDTSPGYSASLSNTSDMMASITSTGGGSEMSGGSEEGSGVSGVFVPSVQVESSDEASGSEDRGVRAREPTKAELWEEVKILSFTRTLTIIYTTSLLTLLTRIQLNILSRRTYLSALLALERAQRRPEATDLLGEVWAAWSGRVWVDDEWEEREWEEGVDGETERAYVSLAWWVVNVGWKEVGERVRGGVEEVLGPVSLKTRVGAEDVERLVEAVRRKVEVRAPGEVFPFASTLLPPTHTSLTHLLMSNSLPPVPSLSLLSLLDETGAWLNVSEMDGVWGEVVSAGVGEWMGVLGGTEGGRLAGVLPGVGKWGVEGVMGFPSRLVAALNGVRELSGLGALVFGYGMEDWAVT